MHLSRTSHAYKEIKSYFDRFSDDECLCLTCHQQLYSHIQGYSLNVSSDRLEKPVGSNMQSLDLVHYTTLDSTALGSNKKISVFQVIGLEILGRVGTHIFFYFLGKKYNFMHFERHFAFQNS